MEDFQGNQEADVANLGAAEHAPHEPSAEYVFWEVLAFWLDRSCARDPKPGPVSGCRHRRRKRNSP
eukprot:3607502-Amphidinium_carterae.1